jgi:hypothetical protein
VFRGVDFAVVSEELLLVPSVSQVCTSLYRRPKLRSERVPLPYHLAEFDTGNSSTRTKTSYRHSSRISTSQATRHSTSRPLSESTLTPTVATALWSLRNGSENVLIGGIEKVMHLNSGVPDIQTGESELAGGFTVRAEQKGEEGGWEMEDGRWEEEWRARC